ncbi:YceI family protein [Roseibacillus ishigakijimensis]|uniref:YceI family protein n=1 Tax=Roseibacillus ishigakijimensis TaxID=454146 RepID=A0A934RTK0_9BACT|nr:YceI family protein [Roseibacillus ishigakijimensis]MBK1835183.1 YceI family protein [Roseibacillus ishigakijimensis]
MKLKQNIILASSLSLFALASCKNPADATTDAEVKEAAPAAESTGGTTYEFTDASTIGFVGSKVTGSHEGGFKEFSGHFIVKDGEPQAGEFTIQMDSVWSDADKLTEHLKNDDFFDVPNFPESQFVVTGFEKKSESSYDVSGNLTLHGVTKNLTFPTTVEVNDELITVSAEFDIDRNEFGVDFEGKKDDLIRKEVIIKFELEAKAAS